MKYNSKDFFANERRKRRRAIWGDTFEEFENAMLKIATGIVVAFVFAFFGAVIYFA